LRGLRLRRHTHAAGADQTGRVTGWQPQQQAFGGLPRPFFDPVMAEFVRSGRPVQRI